MSATSNAGLGSASSVPFTETAEFTEELTGSVTPIDKAFLIALLGGLATPVVATDIHQVEFIIKSDGGSALLNASGLDRTLDGVGAKQGLKGEVRNGGNNYEGCSDFTLTPADASTVIVVSGVAILQ